MISSSLFSFCFNCFHFKNNRMKTKRINETYTEKETEKECMNEWMEEVMRLLQSKSATWSLCLLVYKFRESESNTIFSRTFSMNSYSVSNNFGELNLKFVCIEYTPQREKKPIQTIRTKLNLLSNCGLSR